MLRKSIILLFIVLLIRPVQMIQAQTSSNKYVVVDIKRHDNRVSIIDVQRNDSVFRIYSIIREPIDSTYSLLSIGDSLEAELNRFPKTFLEVSSLEIVEEIYPKLYIGNHSPRGTEGVYLCSRLNGKYIKKDSYPPFPVGPSDFTSPPIYYMTTKKIDTEICHGMESQIKDSTYYLYIGDSLVFTIDKGELHTFPIILAEASVREDDRFTKFLYDFCQDSVFQMKHIRFPLTVRNVPYLNSSNTDISHINRNQWEIIDFWNSHKRFILTEYRENKDIRLNIQIEDTGRYTDYLFKKRLGSWILFGITDRSNPAE
ncbi:MAG: DUF4348 domain-containing protein [Paludibacteraceae bacterium]|nr:DUF4348 domain-containing protein [Paludibacteraceae bacterium]